MTTKREAAKQRIDQALERLTADLAEGRSDELLEYLRCAARFHSYDVDALKSSLERIRSVTRTLIEAVELRDKEAA